MYHLQLKDEYMVLHPDAKTRDYIEYFGSWHEDGTPTESLLQHLHEAWQEAKKECKRSEESKGFVRLYIFYDELIWRLENRLTEEAYLYFDIDPETATDAEIDCIRSMVDNEEQYHVWWTGKHAKEQLEDLCAAYGMSAYADDEFIDRFDAGWQCVNPTQSSFNMGELSHERE